MSDDRRIVPQLPLALGMPPDQRLHTYQQAPDGLLAQLQALAQGEARDAVFLQGAHAVGKSHLLLACCAATEQAGRHPAYLALASLRGRLAAAIEGLDQADLVAVDDVDAIAGQREDEVALFNLHNAVRDAGGWVALGSDSHTAFTLGEFSECRKILDAVGFPEDRILNVTPRRLLNFLESRGMPAIPELAEL